MTERALTNRGAGLAANPVVRSFLTNAGLGLAYLAAFLLVDWLTFVQPVVRFGVTPLNLQTGLTLALLLARGPRLAPLSAVATVASERLIRGSPSSTGELLLLALALACCYGTVAYLMRRFQTGSYLTSLRSAIRLVVTIILAGLPTALVYSAYLVEASVIDAQTLSATAERYWIGEINGMMLAPLLLAAPRWREALKAARARGGEVAAQLLAIALTLPLFAGITGIEQVRFLYPLFVPIIWVAVRWGAPGALLAIVAIQVSLVAQVQDAQLPMRFIDLQFLMLTLGMTGMLLGAAVAERAGALAELATRESELRALLAVAPDAVLTADADGQLRSANNEARELFRLPLRDDPREVTPRRLDALLPGIVLRGKEGRATFAGRREDGSSFPAEVAWVRLEAPAPVGTLAIVRDATVRRLAETQAREREGLVARAMRFAVAGELASALAHELNQPITALVSYLRASQILSGPVASADPRLGETLAKASREANRAAEVLIRLRDFYQGGSGKAAPLDLRALLGGLVDSLDERLRKTGIEVVIRLPADLPTIHSDATRLELVLNNLMSNAIDALGEVAGGQRRIEVHGDVSADAVLLTVEDSGAGIPPEGLPLLFEAFNTSKPDGMGLGLTISRSLVRGQGGDLSYRRGTRLGGAAFTVTLPRQWPPAAGA
jgi:two-component system sensor kinase FixL